MFTDDHVKMIAAAAKGAGIDPASMLAVVECETNGSPFEVDGKTPRLLYERHVAYRHAKKTGASWLKRFTDAGLAIPKWSRSTQYKDQGSSALRLALIARAREIHEEIANASASWGWAQSMGENGPELGFESATALVEYMTEGGLPAQIDVMIREIKSKKLTGAMNSQDFTTFARKYNGPGYAANAYDTRMAAAHKRWARKLPTILAREVAPAHQALTTEELKAVQRKLAALGYKMVGRADGDWGPNTVAALNAFQHFEGLPETGDYDDATKEAMKDAEPFVPSKARVAATADDLRGVSKTVATADSLNVAGLAKTISGTTLVATGVAEQAGLLGQAQEVVTQAQDIADKVGQAKGVWDTMHGYIAPFTSNPTVILIGIVLVVAGFYVSKFAKRIIEQRLEDHRSGAHTGSAT